MHLLKVYFVSKTKETEALDSAISDLKKFSEDDSKNHLKFLKAKRELHNSAREMQKYLEKTAGVGPSSSEMRLRERIKRYFFLN